MAAIPKHFFFTKFKYRKLCEDLYEIVGHGIYYDRFEIQNTKWLRFVSNMVTTINNDKTLSGCFGMYPRFLAGILNSTRRIHFFVLCNEELNYENYIEKCISDKERSVRYKSHTRHYFKLYQSKKIIISFETRLFPKLPSEIIFAQCLEKIQLGCLSYGIETFKGRVTCITNEVMSSRHNYVFKAYFCEFDSPIRLANGKAFTQYCPLHLDDNHHIVKS